jgi:Protein kinase domain
MKDSGLAVLQPGALFGRRYRIDRCINAGGMGAVYAVTDEKTDSRRALKVMLPNLVRDAGLRARFALEARICGNIESDHIVRVSDADVDEATGMPFIVMDLLRGEELGSLIEERGALPPAEVLTYLYQAALALDKTHAAKIVHRDLKPENLFITRRDDGSPCIKILDFGIAKVVSQAGPSTATLASGTPFYMAPEQMLGDGSISPRADLYALGHITYTLLVGEAYWTEEGVESDGLFALLSRIMLGVTETPSARAARRRGVALSAAFDAWFVKMTAKPQEERYERASTAVAALAEVLGEPLPGATAGSRDSFARSRSSLSSAAGLLLEGARAEGSTGTGVSAPGLSVAVLAPGSGVAGRSSPGFAPTEVLEGAGKKPSRATVVWLASGALLFGVGLAVIVVSHLHAPAGAEPRGSASPAATTLTEPARAPSAPTAEAPDRSATPPVASLAPPREPAEAQAPTDAPGKPAPLASGKAAGTRPTGTARPAPTAKPSTAATAKPKTQPQHEGIF